jgi:hypothetical protein
MLDKENVKFLDLIQLADDKIQWWAFISTVMNFLRNAFRILVGKSEGKKSLGRPRHR